MRATSTLDCGAQNYLAHGLPCRSRIGELTLLCRLSRRAVAALGNCTRRVAPSYPALTTRGRFGRPFAAGVDEEAGPFIVPLRLLGLSSSLSIERDGAGDRRRNEIRKGGVL